jgi:hypothetical protein
MRVDAAVVADLQGSRINKGDAAALAFTLLQVATQGHERRWHQFHEAVVAHQARESPPQVLDDVLSIEALEIAVT